LILALKLERVTLTITHTKHRNLFSYPKSLTITGFLINYEKCIPDLNSILPRIKNHYQRVG